MSDTDTVDPQRVQRGLVCMLFDPAYAKRVRGPGALPEPERLSEGERALLREVDPRALGTDDMRRARAMAVIIEEFPVSVAAVGVDRVDRFFSSPVFRACVYERGSMVLSFGAFLGDRARGAGAIELAMARARRAPTSVALEPGELRCPPRFEALEVPAGSLAHYERTRAALGPEPLASLSTLKKPALPPGGKKARNKKTEALLVEAQLDGQVVVGGASAALVALLRRAREPIERAALGRAAVELGAEAGEVDELLDGLVEDGLLASGPPTP